jgi:hypothetical protein
MKCYSMTGNRTLNDHATIGCTKQALAFDASQSIKFHFIMNWIHEIL